MPRSDQEWVSLCKRVKELVPTAISEQAWMLVTAATLASSPSTELMADFYLFLTRKDSPFHSADSCNLLSVQFRDILLKLVTLVGAPRVLCVLIPLAKAEGGVERKSASSVLNNKWKSQNIDVQAIYDRGLATINNIYGPSLLPRIFDSWGAHKEDVQFNEIFTIYGLYLSDFDVLTPLETEAVVYATISCLGLGGPGNWHLRGMGRMLGAQNVDQNSSQAQEIKEQLNSLREAIHTVVRFVGDGFAQNAKLDKWATVKTMLTELGDWGEEL